MESKNFHHCQTTTQQKNTTQQKKMTQRWQRFGLYACPSGSDDTLIFCLQIRKTLEFYEQLRQRMGVVIVGPSGCGKTTLWKNLKNALTKCGQVVKTYVMNPKAMPRTQVRMILDECFIVVIIRM